MVPLSLCVADLFIAGKLIYTITPTGYNKTRTIIALNCPGVKQDESSDDCPEIVGDYQELNSIPTTLGQTPLS